MVRVRRASLGLFLLFCSHSWAQQTFRPKIVAAQGSPGQVLYGATGTGNSFTLVKSTDLGQSWAPVYVTEAGLPQPPLVAFEIDTTDPRILYLATTQAGGLFWESADGGLTWKQSVAGLPQAAGAPDLLRQVSMPAQALYIKFGSQLYKSGDHGEHWSLQSNLPGAGNVLEISLSNPNKMYYVDGPSMQVQTTDDEGVNWRVTGTLNVNITTRSADGVGIVYGNPNSVFVSVVGCCPPGGGLGNNIQGIYRSDDGGATFAWQGPGNGAGEPFTRMFTGPSNEIYALSAVAGGFLRSRNGLNWNSFFQYPDVSFVNLTAIDPVLRSTIYGSSDTVGPVRSTDAGDTFAPINATITPTLAKRAPIQISIEEGAPYTQPFSVQVFENAAWVLAANVTESAPWLALGANMGATPLATTLTVDSTGLAPGTYTTSIQIDAPQSFNKSVTIPVELVVRARGSAAGYRVTTIAGSGEAPGAATTGKAVEVGIGFPGGLAVDATGRVLITATSRLWRVTGSDIELIAGNGTAGTTGDGGAPAAATINAQDVALNAAGDVFLTERFTTPKVRRIAGNTITSYLDRTKAPAFNGSLAVKADPAGRLLLIDSKLYRYDGQSYAQLSNFVFTASAAGLAIAQDGTIFASDQNAHRVMRIAANGDTTVFAGTGVAGFSGDGSPAAQAQLNRPVGLAFDSHGTLFIADRDNNRIRAIGTDGIINTVAGTGVAGYSGDGGNATSAAFNSPYGIAVASDDSIYVGDGSQHVRKLTPVAASGPRLAGLLHGASGSDKLAPGGLFSLYGELLSATTRVAGVTPWPRSLDGVVVTVNGVAAPLYYVSPTQINGQIPYETAVGTAVASVTVNGSAPVQVSFQVVAAKPGILIYGANRAVAVNPDGSVNAATVPAKPGDIELLYFSGIGQPEVPVETGGASPSAEPLGRAKYAYEIRVDGHSSEVFYLGLAPGFPALCQANFRIPDLPPGDYEVTMTINGEDSNAVILTVGAK